MLFVVCWEDVFGLLKCHNCQVITCLPLFSVKSQLFCNTQPKSQIHSLLRFPSLNPVRLHHSHSLVPPRAHDLDFCLELHSSYLVLLKCPCHSPWLAHVPLWIWTWCCFFFPPPVHRTIYIQCSGMIIIISWVAVSFRSQTTLVHICILCP